MKKEEIPEFDELLDDLDEEEENKEREYYYRKIKEKE